MRKLFLTCLLFGFIFFLSIAGVEAKGVKFAVVSDVHVTLLRENEEELKSELTQSINNLQKAVGQINNSDVDFVIFLGDSVDRAEKVSIVMFAKIINGLRKPYYVALGNHDVIQAMGVDKKEYYHLLNMFSHNRIRKIPYVKKAKDDVVFIFMDGVNEFIPGAKGFFKEKELLWLDKELSKYKNKKVVIIQHFPLVEPYPRENHEIHNKDEYLKLLEEHDNVIAIISGHYHRDNEIDAFNIKHISAPALVNSGEYYEIEIEKNKSGKYLFKTKIMDVK